MSKNVDRLILTSAYLFAKILPEENMKDYIFEIQCYEKGNLLKQFADFCGYKLGFYHFYDDHAVVDFIDPTQYDLIVQKALQLEIYAFTVQLSPTCDKFENKKICKEIKEKWRQFASMIFPDYKTDMEDHFKGKTLGL